MTPLDVALRTNRGTFLQRSGLCLGTVAVGTLATAAAPRPAVGSDNDKDSVPSLRPQASTAKRVVYLFQAGAPSRLNCSITSRCSTTGSGRNCPARCGWYSG